MSRANADYVRSLVEPWGRGDFSATTALLCDDVEMSAYLPEGVLVFAGRADVVGFMAEFSAQWQTYRVEVDEVSGLDADTVLVAGRQLGAGATSGLEIAEPVFVVIRLRGEQISGQYWHVDLSKALEAAGIVG